MSVWNFFDGGLSWPMPPKRFRERLMFRIGRWMALRHPHVHIPKSCRIHPGAKIHPRDGEIRFGENCVVAEGAFVQGNVHMGNDCSVQAYTILVGYGTVENPSGRITIGNGVRIASHGMMIASNHRFSDPDAPIHGQGMEHAPIVLEDDIWIGGRVNITAGVTLGRGAVIGSGAVVTKSIPEYAIAVGVPAKVTGSRKREEHA
ncbi:MAG: acetyltransferase [Verrucomicrobia bacterium]|nr:acetyltransferase [Verrucomicrobiota bacterium]MCH8526647.1 acyltransferase [Kiritimatiellia bacterium]